MKLVIILLFILVACGKGNSDNGNNISPGDFGLNIIVPSFDTSTQKKGMIVIPHTPETGAVIKFERKDYSINTTRSSPAVVEQIQKLFRQQIDVRPYDQNENGTYYRARFVANFDYDSVVISSILIY